MNSQFTFPGGSALLQPESAQEKPLADLFLVFGVQSELLRTDLSSPQRVGDHRERLGSVKPQILDSYPRKIREQDHQYICSLEMVSASIDSW